MKPRSVGVFAFGIFCLLQMITLGCAQQAPSQAAATPTTVGNPNAPAITNVIAPETLRESLQDITARVLKLEIDTTKLSTSRGASGIVNALIAGFTALIAALIGGGMTLFAQHMTANRERELATEAAKRQLELAREAAKQQLDLSMKQAVFQQTEKILEFSLKQMELFYGPMFAMFQQSTALYNKMCDQLAQDHPERYKVVPKPDAEGYRCYVLDDGRWEPFRLLDQMPAVKKNAKAMILATRLIKIGKRATKIISEHAGLASEDLVDLLGEYLAHYALLLTVYEGSETEPFAPLQHKFGYFSHELNGKIAKGYRELRKFLYEYTAASKRMLAEFPAKS